MARADLGERPLALAHEGVFHGDGVGVKDVDHIEDVGMQLVQPFRNGHTGGQGDYAVVGGGRRRRTVQDAVAHPPGAGVNSQDAHQGAAP